MPCSDGGPIYPDRVSTARADRNARVACEALRLIEKYIPAYVPGMSVETLQWWAEHQEADLRREEAERQQREREALRDSAISKLTPEERKALGVRL